jgi:hypothetical protein
MQIVATKREEKAGGRDGKIVQSRRELAPSKILHVLVFVFPRPHNPAMPKRPDVSDSGDKPHDDKQDR